MALFLVISFLKQSVISTHPTPAAHHRRGSTIPLTTTFTVEKFLKVLGWQLPPLLLDMPLVLNSPIVWKLWMTQTSFAHIIKLQ